MKEINVYKVKDKTDDNHVAMPLFDLPFKILINGKSQLSGKTTLILNLLNSAIVINLTEKISIS